MRVSPLRPTSGATVVTWWQAFREGWEAHKRPVRRRNQSRTDFFYWSPQDATWVPLAPPLVNVHRIYTVTENLEGLSVNVSNVWRDVRDLFIAVTDQYGSWVSLGQPDVKWDPQIGVWVRVKVAPAGL